MIWQLLLVQLCIMHIIAGVLLFNCCGHACVSVVSII